MIDDLGEALIIDYAEVKARIPIKKADWTRERGRRRRRRQIYKNYFSPQKLSCPVPPLFFVWEIKSSFRAFEEELRVVSFAKKGAPAIISCKIRRYYRHIRHTSL